MKENFKYVKTKMIEKTLGYRIQYRFPKHGTIFQLKNVFVHDLGAYNDQEIAEAYTTGL